MAYKEMSNCYIDGATPFRDNFLAPRILPKFHQLERARMVPANRKELAVSASHDQNGSNSFRHNTFVVRNIRLLLQQMENKVAFRTSDSNIVPVYCSQQLVS